MRRLERVPGALAVFLLVVLIGEACTAEKAVIVSGETLVILGEEFVATGNAMNTALDKKEITPEAYRKWAVFARKFKSAYPLARDLWKAAEDSKDEKLLAQAGAVVAQLGADLGAWTSLVGVR